MSKTLKYSLVFDGGSLGNPGDAYGSFRIQAAGARPQAPQRLQFGTGTNNEAEYLALIAGLERLHGQLRQAELDPASVHLTVSGDSRLIINQVKGEWKVRNPRLRELHAQARRLLQPLGKVHLRYHPRRMSLRTLGH